jgi:hypothetical protein
VLDFDSIDHWAPTLAAALRQHVPDSLEQILTTTKPEYVEDARDMLFDLADRDAIIDAALHWLRSTTLAGYHGSRLTDADVLSIQSAGLAPLEAGARHDRLARALSPHPKWPEVAASLDASLRAHGGEDGRAGSRENQVHLTLSRTALTDGFDHYLTHGAEFDQHVAYDLLGAEGQELLARDGNPRIVTVAVPGPIALEAAHAIFSIDDLRARGDVPNLVDAFLYSWSYRLAYPSFDPGSLTVDCGMMFRHTIPPAWIVDIRTPGSQRNRA